MAQELLSIDALDDAYCFEPLQAARCRHLRTFLLDVRQFDERGGSLAKWGLEKTCRLDRLALRSFTDDGA